MTEQPPHLGQVDVQPWNLCTAVLQELQGPAYPPAPSLEYSQPQVLPSGFVPGVPPCCCSTPAAMELGQNLWVGRCCDLIFLALGAGSGLLASSMGCRMRLRALMNLSRGEGGGPVSHHLGSGGGGMCTRVRVHVHACVQRGLSCFYTLSS